MRQDRHAHNGRFLAGTVRTTRRHGMTLLELMLSLSLTAVVLIAIGMAIDLHLRLLDSRRGKVDRIQLARAVLNLIASDLRAAVQQNNADFSAIGAMATDALASDALSGLADGADLEALAADMIGDTDVSSASTDIATSTTPPPVPGLYGNQYELQIDVSRVPRLDELEKMVSGDMTQSLEDIPSDVKTVAYYYQDTANAVTATNSFHGGTQVQSGLVRRVLDRAVTQYAAEFGNAASLQDVGEVIAPEVIGIEFAYFDGYEWLMEWDSGEKGGLPVAVRITMVVTPDDVANPTDTLAAPAMTGSGSVMTAVSTDQIYSLVVRLPTALPCEETQETDSGMEAVGL